MGRVVRETIGCAERFSGDGCPSWWTLKSTTIAEGNTINFTGVFKEVDELKRLVMTIEIPDMPSDAVPEIVTVTFKEIVITKQK